ncbi:Uncharacterised protein r2_g91 [Pycnogonum litorale]
MKVVDYTIPCGRGTYGMLFRKQPTTKLSLSGYISVLSFPTWIAIVSCYFCITATLVFISMFNNSTFTEDFKTGDYWHLAFSVFTMQGLATEPKRTSSRFLILCTWYITNVLFLFYSSVLISHLITNDNSAPVSNLYGLVTSSTYRPVFVKSSAIYNTIKVAHPDVSPDVWKRIEESTNDFFVDTIEDGIEAAFHENVGFVWTTKYLALIQNRNASFVVVEIPSVRPLEWSFLLQRDSPYLNHFNRAIVKMHESGITERIERKYRLKELPESNAHPPTAMDLRQTYFPFLVLLIGIVTSIIALLLEVFYRSKFGDGINPDIDDLKSPTLQIRVHAAEADLR